MLVANPGSRPLAGGQSLLNVLKHRAAEVEAVIDISRLEELRGIDAEGGRLEIGAACSYDRIAASDAVAAAHPKIAAVADGLSTSRSAAAARSAATPASTTPARTTRRCWWRSRRRCAL